jgi:DNA-binding NtrC family response regulator
LVFDTERFTVARVLIVEDEEQVRVLAESILEEAGHQALSASSAEEAMALLQREEHIDLLFTDLGLQSDLQGGLKLASAAKERAAGLPVVYTTGQGLTDGMKALFVEPFGFLPKPYTGDQLTNAVAKLTSRAAGRSRR